MASSAFDNLVAPLSSLERSALLERIKMGAHVSTEPLYPPSAAPAASAFVSTKLEEMGIITRLVMFFRGLISGKSPDELLREDELKAISRRVELKHMGLIDRRRELVLQSFAEELRALRDAARFFYDALDRSIEKDKAAFYGFLASIEIPETHERLLTEASPATIATGLMETRGSADEASVRSAAIAAFNQAFSELSERGRRSMYQDLRSVLFLKRLSGFLFDRLLACFKPGAYQDTTVSASFFELRELFLELGDILFSMSEPPSTELIQAIFLFADRETLGRDSDSAGAAMSANVARAEASLTRIRAFNSRVPMGDLLRLVAADPAYLPRDLPGGEDWFVTYKAYWRERIDLAFEAWKEELRIKALVEEISEFVGQPGPGGFAHISQAESEEGPGVRFQMALVFLDAFYRGPFIRELNRPLNSVLVDGDFYRKDNRVEFTDAYDSLLRLPELLSAFDAKLGPQGELGLAWHLAMTDMGAVGTRSRRLGAVSRLAEEEATFLLLKVGGSLRIMTQLIQGFLKGEAGGRFDSLANLSYINGKFNKEFIRGLERAKARCERAATLLSGLSGLNFDRSD